MVSFGVKGERSILLGVLGVLIIITPSFIFIHQFVYSFIYLSIILVELKY